MKNLQFRFITVAIILSLLLCSCGGGSSGESPGIDKPAAPEPFNAKTSLEMVDYNLMTFTDFEGSPSVSSYIAYKNNSTYNLQPYDITMDYADKDGNYLTSDMFAKCIPSVVKPGQVFYIYSYYFDLEDTDTSNGLYYNPACKFNIVDNIYELEVSDLKFKTDNAMGVTINARAINDTDDDKSPSPGAVFFDENNKVVGFCYGMDTFSANTTSPFMISGDVMSEELDPSIVDHVEVYIQEVQY